MLGVSFHRVQRLQWHSGSNNRQLGTEITVFSMSALGLGLVGGGEVGVRGRREGGKVRQVTHRELQWYLVKLKFFSGTTGSQIIIFLPCFKMWTYVIYIFLYIYEVLHN